jgi:uncharacterized membrane protein
MSSYLTTPRRAVLEILCRSSVVISFMGLFAAATLSLGYVLDLPVPCGGSNGCASVAAHSSSKLLGVPIAFFGVATYFAIIWLLTRIAQTSWAPLLLTTAALSEIVANHDNFPGSPIGPCRESHQLGDDGYG